MKRAAKAKPTKPTALDPVAFRKLAPADQLRALRGQRVERVFEVQRDTIDKEKRTVWLSIASEQPYERWWGVEILDCSKGSIRADRLRSGAPLLVGHDPADQVGVVEDFEITPDRRLRVLARFSRSARAEEIWQDVLDGIRRNTSVGYMIHDLVLERQEEEVCTYRVNDWEPYEGSLVAIPADPTVGVGREHEVPATEQTNEENDMHIRQSPEGSGSPGGGAPSNQLDATAIAAREAERINSILAAGDQYKNFGGPEVARDVIKDPSATIDTFKSKMLEKIGASGGKPQATAEPAAVPYGMGGRQVILRGGQLRAFTKPLRFTDGSSMDPIDCAYRSGQWLLATVGNNVRSQRWCRDNGIDIEHRVMQVSNSTLGGYLVPTEMEQAIIDLREAYGLARRLCRRRPMASDTKSIPKRTGGVTAYFIEEDNAGVTASDKNWGNVNLVSKTLAALSLISKNIEEDSIIDVVDDLASEHAYAFAQKEDQCWLIGDGTSTYGGMTGLITLFEATAYASRFTAAAAHDTFPEFDNSDLTGVMGNVADFPGINPVWVNSKTFAETVFSRLKATAGGNNVQTLDGRPRYGYLGYDSYTSEIMPKDSAADYTNKVVALFGDFGLSSSVGDRRGIMIEVLRERYAEKLQVGILGHERFQVVNHDVGSTTVKGPVAALYGGT